MSLTSLTLVWLGSVALLATMGLFYQFGDAWTGVLVDFVASGTWALFVVASMDVVVGTGTDAAVSEAMMPLAYLGIGFAILTLLFGINDLLAVLRGDVNDVDLGNVGSGR